MKTPYLLAALSIAVAAAMPAIAADPAAPGTPASPAEATAAAPAAPVERRKGKGRGKVQRPAEAIRAIDSDHDRKLDNKEVAELKKQFEANPKGPLGRFDMNANGALETDEIKIIKDRMARHGEGKGDRQRGAGKRKRNR